MSYPSSFIFLFHSNLTSYGPHFQTTTHGPVHTSSSLLWRPGVLTNTWYPSFNSLLLAILSYLFFLTSWIWASLRHAVSLNSSTLSATSTTIEKVEIMFFAAWVTVPFFAFAASFNSRCHFYCNAILTTVVYVVTFQPDLSS